MNEYTGASVPGSGADAGRKSLWVIRELGLPTILRACTACRSNRHYPSGKFRVNANGKLLDVWLLVGCESCDRTSKVPVHERIQVQALENARLRMCENNDPAAVREITMSASLADKSRYRLDWSGTWRLETDSPFHACDDPQSLEVAVGFELPVPICVENLLSLGFGVSRARIRSLVASGRIQSPQAQMPVLENLAKILPNSPSYVSGLL